MLEETNDRGQQVGQLRQLAQELTSNQWEGTADEIVQFWLDQKPGLPSWFDDFDKELLVVAVESAQNYRRV